MNGFNGKKVITGMYFSASLIFFICCGIFFYSAFTTKNEKNVYLYKSVNVDDTVFLKENNFYEDKYLKNQNKYISSLIENIAIDFNYNYSLSNNVDYDISYYVDSLIYIYEVEHPENVLWKKHDVLVDTTKVKKKNSSLKETVEINYHKYDMVVKDFVKNYLLFTDAKLKIDFHIIMDCKEEEYSKELDYEDVITVEIPLNEQTINIFKPSNGEDNVLLSVSHKTFNILSVLFVILGIGCLVLAFFSLNKFISLLKIYFLSRTSYQKNLDKILKNYDHLIVSANSMPKFDGLIVIQVKSFEELLDAQEELRMPIIYYEIEENQKSIFAIINNTNACIYYLEDLEII